MSGALPIKGAAMSYNDLNYLTVLVLLGYVPPVIMTTNPQEVSGQVNGNGVYLYERLISPDSRLCRLVRFTNVIRIASVHQ